MSEEERKTLSKLVKTGKASAYKQQPAQILFKADVNRFDDGFQDKNIAKSLDVGIRTIKRTWQRLVEKRFQKALERESYNSSRAAPFER